MSNPTELALKGIFYLEEAILEVLFEAMEAHPEDPYLRRVEIRQKIGVYDLHPKFGWTLEGTMHKLKAEDRVEQREKRGPWKLTETEYQKRR